MVVIGARDGEFIYRAEANGTMKKLLFRLYNNDSFAKVKVSASLILALAKPHLSEFRAFESLW